MENEFECLADRGGQDLTVAEKFLKKYCSIATDFSNFQEPLLWLP